jgi:hypothetical protein
VSSHGAVGDHRQAESQVVFGDGVADDVAFLRHIDAAVAQRLLDGVDAQVDAAGRPRQRARDRRLANAGSAVDEDQRDHS